MSKLLFFLSKLSGSLQVYYKGHSAATLGASMAVLKCHKTIRCAANYAEAEERERDGNKLQIDLRANVEMHLLDAAGDQTDRK